MSGRRTPSDSGTSDVAGAGQAVPRVTVQRGSARSTLLNALGEFALLKTSKPPPTGALIGALACAGIAHHAGRQAVQRCARSGWITGVRDGRESRWQLTTAGRELLSDGIARVEALGADDAVWSGRWLIVICSIPQEQRAVRERLYRGLRWHGCGSPMPGLWISAHPERQGQVRAAVSRWGLDESTASFVGGAGSVGLSEADLIDRAWDLPSLADRYSALCRQFSPRRAADPAQAMANLLALDEQLQGIPAWDPHLPYALAPRWPGRESAARLLALRTRWLSPARRHWAALVS